MTYYKSILWLILQIVFKRLIKTYVIIYGKEIFTVSFLEYLPLPTQL